METYFPSLPIVEVSHLRVNKESRASIEDFRYGVLGSQEKRGQNNQGAGSRVGIMLGSREQGNNLGSREQRKKF